MADAGREGMDEFGIIADYFAPLAGDAAALGLKDDAAILRLEGSTDLAVSADTVVEGVHFLPDDPPETVAHKALAVNLSDLAAKGADPLAYLLSISLPTDPASPCRDPAWLSAFSSGLGSLQISSGIRLIGGDTTATPGPLSIAITALGRLAPGEAVLRSGAKLGDILYVSGSVGDAVLGLRLLVEPERKPGWGLTEAEAAALVARYRSPAARTSLAPALRAFAHAAIDISDGLAGDLEKLCTASGTGASLRSNEVPLSPAASKAVASAPALLAQLLGGGDDYEILAAVPANAAPSFEAAARAAEIAVTAIGEITASGQGIVVLDRLGDPVALPHRGYRHFSVQTL